MDYVCRYLCFKTNFEHTLTYSLFLHTIFPVRSIWENKACPIPNTSMYILDMSVPCELGWKLENKLKNEVKIQNFPHKMSI